MNANRSLLFAAGIAVAIICLIIAIVYFAGGPLGHHIKHGLLFLGIAVVAALFAVVNRPMRTVA